MGNTRLKASIVTVVLLAGTSMGCNWWRTNGTDPNAGQPGSGVWPGHHPQFHALMKRREIKIVAGDAVRRKSALDLFTSDRDPLGLLNQDSEPKRTADSETALRALKETIQEIPSSLERTFGSAASSEVSKDVEFKQPICVHSACLVDVSYSNWRAFDAIDQLLEVDQDVAWNKYTAGTRYRSGRIADPDDPHRFIATWALVFPLKSIDDQLAEHPPKPPGGKPTRAGRSGRKGVGR